ncbi:MAG: 3-phosphoshikimate 1-carboxyvinyltransferase, partial [Opitutae bacterium]|nr:3-phosphoshikimate 1-carboxyvinyltransferase [Opitutae bacterium]
MTESISITPFTSPCRGEAKVPGSKSITNRALLLAALSNRKVTLDGALFSDDVEIMVGALTSLGFTVNTDKQTARITVKGESGRIPKQSGDLFVGNAGTVARFLTAALCLRWG